MIRIRRVYDDILPANKERLKQVQEILSSRFSGVPEEEILQIGEKLRNPFKKRFRSVLFVAESFNNKVLGFAFLLHEPEIKFCYLDWIAAANGRTGGGLGSALYETIRTESVDLKARGLFFECLPDDITACPDESLLNENRSRLRFYERYGARPIVHTAYETPIKPGDTCMPHLVYDGLDQNRLPGPKFMRKVVRAILERKYAEYCPREYVEHVVSSFRDNPIRLRDYKYIKPEAVKTQVKSQSVEQISLVVNDRHSIHHIHELGYVESPVRVGSILKELEKTGLFVQMKPRSFPEKNLQEIHDPHFINYLRKACEQTPENESLYPYIFPIRNKTRPPKEPSVLSGYYCIDTFTPINRNAYPAARRGIDCALTAAQEILRGRRISYALIRPPGHHAERSSFGGFCYFNNSAAAAQYLSHYGKVAILDIDYHHGNGQQDIFLKRSDILTISIHGHPRFAYPYFTGFEDERGQEDGEGFNLNFPLPESVDGDKYRKTLDKALRRIDSFNPYFLVVPFGLDTAKGDPTGTWSMSPRDFEANGRMIGELGLPVVVIQEGGYKNRTLGTNALRFFNGLAAASLLWKKERKGRTGSLHGLKFLHDISPSDPERIKRLVEITGFFYPAEVDMAEELARERLARGSASGYDFILAEHYGQLAAYSCYGPITGTVSSFKLYWIAVQPDFQGKGLGRRLLKLAEARIRKSGGTRIYVETSQRPQYASTRAFYENQGYHPESVLDHFYGPNEGKITYCKAFTVKS
ncbi:MAG: GNAT family N-acetyltransferase [Deltaproteobacteria bacterium]|nr:GNAT family N-acetyltransferase [Deltaproteobacteria bacterium]